MNKKEKEQKYKELVASFIILLVLSMPFYSAEVMAANVEILQNTGQKEIDGFVDGKGDIWKVQAKVWNLLQDTLLPDDLQITLGGNKDKFDSCSISSSVVSSSASSSAETSSETIDSTIASTDSATTPADSSTPASGTSGSSTIVNSNTFICDYTSDLSSGAAEDHYTAQQNLEGKIVMDFTVADKPDFGVGMGRVDILDADTGAILQTISIQDKKMSFNFRTDGGSEGIVSASETYLTGAGKKRLQVKAYDRLGHEASSNVRQLNVDFNKPNIVSKLNFTDLNGFIGATSEITSLVVEIEENTGFKEITAYSDQVEFLDHKASSVELISENLWRARWDNVKVNSVDSVTVEIKATDTYLNVDEKNIPFTFARDVIAPQAVFFGSEKVYNDVMYVNPGENTILLKVVEQGAGITPDMVKVDLRSITGPEGEILTPAEENCQQTENSFDCNFTINVGEISGEQTLRLVQLTDKVGNEGEHISKTVIVDSVAPSINGPIEIFGSDAAGVHDYFKSGDKLLFRLNISERAGIFFKVDLRNVIMNAEEELPSGKVNEAGWEVFTQDNCISSGNYWLCEFLSTKSMMSDYIGQAEITLELEDTAGNKVSDRGWPDEKKDRARKKTDGVYSFKKLAVDENLLPDYWEMKSSSAKPMVKFIDLETTSLINTRMGFDVTMNARSGRVSALSVQLVSCDSDFTGGEGRQVLWNNIYITPQSSPVRFNLILEFPPFDGKEYFKDQLVGNFEKAVIKETCTFQIYSKVDKKALATAETETVEIEVPFGFTELGSSCK
ncbi:hypothetical protein HYX12_01190 [Candidatus Woesearchaeota archaeon]|nr:hypothetical protein [Candidatus Woesearchaeota archaeon]